MHELCSFQRKPETVTGRCNEPAMLVPCTCLELGSASNTKRIHGTCRCFCAETTLKITTLSQQLRQHQLTHLEVIKAFVMCYGMEWF
ncbi:hypothetical protein QVD17_24242 [Tagetes erecta]|uniref:Uncharacterized protein n=1 Tax=Tagetes erecta TaxID=13708 RepID=A0AAD8NMN5_TARER|nr:hypothetical protein QVD17_24242 [Tagetes erecta]